MSQSQYNVVFRGALTGDKPEGEVKAELAALFKAPAERIEALFSGRPVVVKRNVDAATATKFRAAFQRAGAFCELVPVDDDDAPAPASQSGAEREPAPPATPDQPAPAAEAAPAAGGGSGAMAVAGDPNQTVVNLAVPSDLSHLSFDDSDRPHQPHEETPPPEVDISGLSLAGDEPLPGRRDEQPERAFDTSGMSLEPAPEPTPRETDSG